jgi:hypothetical protein
MICLSHQKRKVREEENEKKKETSRVKQKRKKNEKSRSFDKELNETAIENEALHWLRLSRDATNPLGIW